MLANNMFSKEIAKKLNYYVYRLVDPRNGLTFYIGKGKGNRVFHHQNGIIDKIKKDDWEDELSLKMKTIHEITLEGFAVIPFIHRHNLTEGEAYLVEGALIDAYAGLANVQNGHGNMDYGIMSVEQIIRRYKKEQLDEIPEKALIIKIKDSWIEYFMQEKNISQREDAIYQTVTGNWKIGNNRENAEYVFAVSYGVIVGIYKNIVWRESEKQPGRWKFTAEKAEDIWDRYIDKIIPDKFMKKGAANPIQYTFRDV